MKHLRALVTVLLLLVMAAGASAQTLAPAPTLPRRADVAPIAKAVTVHAQSNLQLDRLAAARSQRDSGGDRRGPGKIILGAAVGATAGFFAGGYLGSWIDGDCGGCDDPGLKGALIGAPIGAVAGGILGGKFLF